MEEVLNPRGLPAVTALGHPRGNTLARPPNRSWHLRSIDSSNVAMPGVMLQPDQASAGVCRVAVFFHARYKERGNKHGGGRTRRDAHTHTLLLLPRSSSPREVFKSMKQKQAKAQASKSEHLSRLNSWREEAHDLAIFPHKKNLYKDAIFFPRVSRRKK